MRLNAERLISHLQFHARKILVRNGDYAGLADDAGIADAYAAGDAVSALYRLGCLEIRTRGDVDVLELLDGDIDRFASPVGAR